jgi:general nucleoside transport system ATP-binding protein
MSHLISLQHLSKSFGKTLANNDVSLDIRSGEILALLGENGSGKTTLMNLLSGIYYPDAGKILIDGDEVKITSPAVALSFGIGMVHQHFKLIDVFTVGENITLGEQDGFFLKQKEIDEKIQALSDKYGFGIDPKKKVYDLSVGEKQKVEIVKLLYRGMSTLILDEPTAVLTPQETDNLFKVLRKMREDGKAIIIITHKLSEVLSLSERVAILRNGKLIQVLPTRNATEGLLTDLMVGEHVKLDIERALPVHPQPVLEISHLTTLDPYGVKTLDDVSFTANSGEILGIAGVSGSGQKALLEAISGLQKAEKGSSIRYHYDKNHPVVAAKRGHTPVALPDEAELVGKSVREIKELGIALAFVPEDRLGMGLVGDMGMVDNMLLRSYSAGKSPFLSYEKPSALAEEVKDKLMVSTPSLKTPIRKLSGGNVQKVLVGREIASAPRVLMTAYAVRGLDINTSYMIYNILNDQKKAGLCVVYVGEDLDVLMELCDRILVLCDGKATGILDARKTSKSEVGALMVSQKGDLPHEQA